MATRGLKFSVQPQKKTKKNIIHNNGDFLLLPDMSQVNRSQSLTKKILKKSPNFENVNTDLKDRDIIEENPLKSAKFRNNPPKLKKFLDKKKWLKKKSEIKKTRSNIIEITTKNTRNGSLTSKKKSIRDCSPTPKIDSFISPQSKKCIPEVAFDQCFYNLNEGKREVRMGPGGSRRRKRLMTNKSQSLVIKKGFKRANSIINNKVEFKIDGIHEVNEVKRNSDERAKKVESKKERKKRMRKNFKRVRSILKTRNCPRSRAQSHKKQVQFKNYNTIMKFNPKNDINNLEHRIKKKKFTKIIFRGTGE